MPDEIRPRGRPKGQGYPVSKHLRLRAEDGAELQRLAAHWRCSDSEAIRRAIRETARREGVGVGTVMSENPTDS